MDEIMRAIGWPSTWPAKAALVGVFLCFTAIYLVVLHFLTAVLPDRPVVVHVVAWALWLIWQGVLFPRRRKRHVAALGEYAYRRAFWTDILFGASFALFLVVSPAYYAEPAQLTAITPLTVLGAVVLLAGVTIVSVAVSTIGLATAGFRYEYPGAGTFRMSSDSIYEYMDHPIFVGGILVSCGIALVVGTAAALRLALVNVATIPVYSYLEAHRLATVFGDDVHDGRSSQ